MTDHSHSSDAVATLRSHVLGSEHAASGEFTALLDPSTEEVVARASTRGLDFGAVLDYARERGGPALRAMSFAERGEMLRTIGKALRERRDELLELSRRNHGTTAPDGAFDIDGASGVFSYYGSLGKSLGVGHVMPDGEPFALLRTEAFWGRHVLLPREGVAVHINAFNFPAWGLAEKAAQALLAGVPVVTKPATATAWVAERVVSIAMASGVLPEGALQSLVGSTGNLLDLLGPQDVVAFTGSADTARGLRTRPAVVRANCRFNVEADSLNVAVLAPDVEPGSEVFTLFVRDVAREITQKSGQKCTAIRRILAPPHRLGAVEAALVAALEGVRTGAPGSEGVTMGPLATAAQLADAERGVAELVASGAVLRHGTGRRIDGEGAPPGKGFFFGPALLVCADPRAARAVHEREVFAPVATLMPHSGSVEDAAALVALGGGTLVASVYGDDAEWLANFLRLAGSSTGRLYVGSSASAKEAPGSGLAFPQTQHGGPGRAGGGEELGGLAGLRLYQQRVALQGAKSWLDGVA